MKTLTIAKAVAVALTIGAPAGAATLDFSGLPLGRLGDPVLVLSNATLTSGGDDLFNIAGQGICAFNLAFNCEADLDIDFDSEVSDLSFQANGFNAGDFVLAQAFSATNALLGAIEIEADGVFSFGALGGISRLLLADSSTGAGYSWNNFQFNETAAPVPLPAALPLMLGGMAAAGAFLRRRKA
ncbi:VPLPA-CTERM sorting domain-containing protein [Amaricoccus sp.]|uniref:VPLPA-CTERM sorting domain-containing protein n=1 Tax=Amaricoccus sp. TaxID=1872485 RepID=UPI001B43C16B|nr:VPLPA-CTERM sorting domain-containing protein [Amaricoccus sp.]MBP7002034.1 VPLPA-CTERM sorting domain-containing protein [Amaricoccus sp.]